MIDFFDNIDNDLNDGGTRVVPIFTEIHETDDKIDIQDNQAEDIPILPLRNMVLFPSMTMPVSVGREKSMQLIRDASEHHSPIAVFCQFDSRVEDPIEKDLYRTGTIASIVKVLELPDGSTNVILQGRSACSLDKITSVQPYLHGDVSLVEEKLPLAGDKEFEVLLQSIVEVTMRMLRNMGNNGRDLAFAMKNIDNPFYLMNFLATNIAFDPEQKQRMLEEHDIKKRGYLLYSLLSQEEQLVEIASVRNPLEPVAVHQRRAHLFGHVPPAELDVARRRLVGKRDDALPLRERPFFLVAPVRADDDALRRRLAPRRFHRRLRKKPVVPAVCNRDRLAARRRVKRKRQLGPRRPLKIGNADVRRADRTDPALRLVADVDLAGRDFAEPPLEPRPRERAEFVVREVETHLQRLAAHPHAVRDHRVEIRPPMPRRPRSDFLGVVPVGNEQAPRRVVDRHVGRLRAVLLLAPERIPERLADERAPLRRTGVLQGPVGIAGRVGIAPRKLQPVLEIELLHEVLPVLQPIAPSMVESALLQEREPVCPRDRRGPHAGKAVRNARIQLDGRVDVLVVDIRAVRRPGARGGEFVRRGREIARAGLVDRHADRNAAVLSVHEPVGVARLHLLVKPAREVLSEVALVPEGVDGK